MFYTGVFDFTDIDNLQQDIQQLPRTFDNAMLDLAVDVETTYLPQLQTYPDTRAKHPFQFATPRSRRKYFAMIASGEVQVDDYGYVRTGGYAQSWMIDVTQQGDEYTLTVYSTFPAAKYVGGKQQVPGHANTGWLRYDPLLDAIGDYANRQFFNLVRPFLV